MVQVAQRKSPSQISCHLRKNLRTQTLRSHALFLFYFQRRIDEYMVCIRSSEIKLNELYKIKTGNSIKNGIDSHKIIDI